MASWERQCASQCLHFQVPFFVFKGALGQIIPNSTLIQLEFLKHFIMWTIHSLYFQPPKKNRKWSVLFIHTPLNPIQPQQKKTSHPPPEVYQQKFTPENMLPKQEDKTFVDLRPLYPILGGWGGRALRSHFSGPFPCLLAVQLQGVPLGVQVPRANMKHPPRRKTTTKVPSEPPEREDEANETTGPTPAI